MATNFTVYQKPVDQNPHVLPDNQTTEIHAYPEASEAVDRQIAIDHKRSKKTYHEMIKSADETLFSAKTAFPFTLFPSYIVVDRNQVNIAIGVFFSTKQYLTFLIESINNVIVRKGVLFAEIEFEVTGHEQNPPKVNYLENRDAEQVKKIIDAILLAKASNVDVWELAKEEVLHMAEKLTFQNNFKQADSF